MASDIPRLHEVAQTAIPYARIVQVDYDPFIHAHANALLAGTGTTKVILADLRDPGVIVAGAQGFLDLARPVALLLVAIPHFIPDAEAPRSSRTSVADSHPPPASLVLSAYRAACPHKPVPRP